MNVCELHVTCRVKWRWAPGSHENRWCVDLHLLELAVLTCEERDRWPLSHYSFPHISLSIIEGHMLFTWAAARPGVFEGGVAMANIGACSVAGRGHRVSRTVPMRLSQSAWGTFGGALAHGSGTENSLTSGSVLSPFGTCGRLAKPF